MKLAACVLILVFLATSWAKPTEKRRSKMFNPNLFEGDIKLPGGGKDRNAVPYDRQRWPGGVITYKIHPDLNPVTKKNFKHVIDYLEQRTCLQFVERTTERNYVKVFEGDGCFAHIGFINSGEQELSLESHGCEDTGSIFHELLHAVGFEHEHGRYDRDDYIIIHWDNIDEEQYGEFEKRGKNEERRFTPFDFESIMLYGPTAFAHTRGLITMEARDGRKIKEIEAKKYPSASDIKRINILYECPN